MTLTSKPTISEDIVSSNDDAFDLNALLHPAQAFSHPSHVVDDPDLTLNEKRAILSSWASDACAVEAAPTLRKISNGPVVSFDDIMDALRKLDRQSNAADARRCWRSIRRRRIFDRGRGGETDQGSPFC